jgi:hypothetical protein
MFDKSNKINKPETLKNTLNKKIIINALASLFIFSCATKSPPQESKAVITTLPPINQTQFDTYVSQAQASFQLRNFLRIGQTDGAGTGLSRNGLKFNRGLDRMVALRGLTSAGSDGTARLKNSFLLSVGYGVDTNKLTTSGTGLNYPGPVSTFVTNCSYLNGGLCVTENSLGQVVNNTLNGLSTSTFTLLDGGFTNGTVQGGTGVLAGNVVTNTGMGFAFYKPGVASSEHVSVEGQDVVGGLNSTGGIASTSFFYALRHAQTRGAKLMVYDFIDNARFGNTYGGGNQNQILGAVNTWYANDNGTAFTSGSIADTSGYISVAKMADYFSRYIALGGGRSLVLPTGTGQIAGGQVSYGYFSSAGASGNTGISSFGSFADSFITGDMVRWMAINKGIGASQNTIAMSIPVMASSTPALGADYTYTPYADSVLPGALRDYSFAVPLNDSVQGSSTLVIPNVNGINGRLGNTMLASSIHTLGLALNSNQSAISFLKSNFTLKTYGNGGAPVNVNTTYSAGTFYKMTKAQIIANIQANPSMQNAIIRYFDSYSSLNGNKIGDSSLGATTIAYDKTNSTTLKWNAIALLYGQNQHMLSQFITNSDVIVCTADCLPNGSNIIAMNGIFGNAGDFAMVQKPYQFYDSNGNLTTGYSKVYYYKGEEIASNVFGNGIVDFTSLYNTAVKSQNNTYSRFFDTKAQTSAVMGDGFQRKEISDFLSKMHVSLGSVYADSTETAILSLKDQVGSSVRDTNYRTQAALANLISLDNDIAQTRSSFDLGFANLSFAVYGSTENSKNLSTAALERKRLMNGIAGGASRYGEEMLINQKALVSNNQNASNISGFNDITFTLPVSGFGSVSFLNDGRGLESLSLNGGTSQNGSFSIISRNTGLRESYNNYAEIFSDAKNVNGMGTAFNLNSSSKVNIIVANAKKENILNGQNNSSNFGAVEFGKTMGSNSKKQSSYTVSTGVMTEKQGFLGSIFSGGLGIESAETYFASFNSEVHLAGTYFINAGASYGITNITNEKNSIANYSNVNSYGFNVGVSNKNFLGGTVAINYSQPITIANANVSLFNGKEKRTFDISSEGREQNLEASFALSKKTTSIKAALVHTEDLNNMKGERQNIIVLNLRKQF